MMVTEEGETPRSCMIADWVCGPNKSTYSEAPPTNKHNSNKMRLIKIVPLKEVTLAIWTWILFCHLYLTGTSQIEKVPDLQKIPYTLSLFVQQFLKIKSWVGTPLSYILKNSTSRLLRLSLLAVRSANDA